MNTYIFFWDVRRAQIFRALLIMAFGHLSLKRDRSVKFYKLLGTGKGETFTPRDANFKKWALLIIYEGEIEQLKVLHKWRKIAESEKQLQLSALSVKGNWNRQNPFQVHNLMSKQQDQNNSIAAITRAKIKFHLLFKFWRSVPPVVESLQGASGLLWTVGIGETPIGLQGTFSIWKNGDAIKKFAYQGAAHQAAIAKTERLRWYSEELFGRFEILNERDTLLNRTK
jgi:hypothetical protein